VLVEVGCVSAVTYVYVMLSTLWWVWVDLQSVVCVLYVVVQYLTSLGIQAFAKHSAFCAIQPALW